MAYHRSPSFEEDERIRLDAERGHPVAIREWNRFKDRAPTLDRTASIALQIYNVLQKDRPIGFGGVGPIPTRALIDYCKFLGYDRYDIEAIRMVIGEVENAVAEMDRAAEDKKAGPHK